MTTSSLQEIICCIGHPVAANPTQYVMEQALGAASLDFRCLTLDVTPEALDRAIDGMRAMGFLGAILAAPHQERVAELLDEIESHLASTPYIDFIRREGERLIGECLLCAAVLQFAGSHVPHPKSAVVFGESARELVIAQTLASAGITTTVVGDAPSNALLLTQAETGATTPSIMASDAESEMTEVSELPAPTPMHRMSFIDYKSAGLVADMIVHGMDRDLAGDVHWPPDGAAHVLAIDLTDEPVQTEFLQKAKGMGHQTFHSVDVRLASLMIAFRRWTNGEPDENLMRDALEEFLLV